MDHDDARIRPGPEPGGGESPARRLGRRIAWASALALAVPALIAISVPVVATGQDTPDGAASPTAVAEDATTATTATAEAAGTPDGAPEAVAEEPVAAAAEPPAPAPVTGTGRDPLTPDEATYAAELAAAAAVDGATDVDGDAGVEPLSVELASAEPGSDPLERPRIAEVYGYDYTTDELVKQVIDLTAGEVVRSASARGMQPPPSEAEIAAAFDLFLADPASDGFQAQHRIATGTQLTDPAQVTVTGASFIVPDGTTEAAACGAHRCLNLFAQIPDGPYVDLSAIVIDLSDQTVSRLQ